MRYNGQLGLYVLLGSVGLLSACGGGSSDASPDSMPASSAVHLTAGSAGAANPNAEAPLVDLMAKSADLNSQELAQALVAAQTQADKSVVKAGTRTAPISATQVFRFYNTLNQAHFFTSSESERDVVQASIPTMQYDGPAFFAASQSEVSMQPVYRFRNVQNGVHFYTISEQEKSYIQANLSAVFTLEGVAYRASATPGVGLMPLYRFYLASKGFHFYTTNEAEVANIRASLPQYIFEGVSYYVPNPNPSATVVSPLGGQLTWNIPAEISVVLSGPFGAPVAATPACSTTDAAKVSISGNCSQVTVKRLDARDVVSVTGGGYTVKLPLSSTPQRHWSGRHGLTDGFGVVITQDNRALLWSGSHSEYSQVLGQGTTRSQQPYVTYPIPIKNSSGSAALSDVVQASGGDGSALALGRNGSIWFWGSNDQCAGGIGTQYPSQLLLPVQIKNAIGSAPLTNVVQAETGSTNGIALLDDGRPMYWGSPALPGIANMRCLPALVPGPNGVGFLNDIAQVSAGRGYNLALTRTGKVYAFGNDSGDGLLGSGVFILNSNPPSWPMTVKKADGSELTNIVQVSAGYNNGMALDSNGRVWIWGQGETNGIASYGSQPEIPYAALVPSLSNITMVAAGGTQNYALDTLGQVWSWAFHGQDGTLGDGPGNPRGIAAPGEPDHSARTPGLVVTENGLGTLTGALSIAASYNGGSALMPDGRVLNWGTNNIAALGQGIDRAANGLSWSLNYNYVPVPLRNETNTGSLVLNPASYPNIRRRGR